MATFDNPDYGIEFKPGAIIDLEQSPNKEAKRNPVNYRFDILFWPFLKAMAQIAFYGADKYGDFNWQKSRLTGEKSPINHLSAHLTSYSTREQYEYFDGDPDWHLVAIAFNAMMEYWYNKNGK